MAARGKHAASVSVTSAGRRAFLERRARSEPAIRAAREALLARSRGTSSDESGLQLGTFEMLYQSDDGRLCLFQTEDGHLSAVDSSKLI